LVFHNLSGRNVVAGRPAGNAVNSVLASVAALALALSIGACSGVPANPEGAARKMMRAYGGPAKAARLETFSGKGFIRDLSSEAVAKSYAFDIYRKGPFYKQVIMSAPGGKLTDVIVVYFDGTTAYAWMNGKGTTTIDAMELGLLKYRFPDVIQWAQGASKTGEVLPGSKGDDPVRVRYRDGDLEVILALDRKSWLLSSVEVKSPKVSSDVFVESYNYYTDVEGIPFPQEFKATYRGNRYYEYMLVKIELGGELPDSLFRVTAEDTTGLAKPPKVEKQTAPKR
jgi:hypothetical protein